MTQSAVLIACENYADPLLPKIEYGAADVAAVGKALEQHGFAAADQTLLVDGKSTKSLIESRVRKLLRGAQADDAIYLYYVGHGFAHRGASYLTCGDSVATDLVDTSIALKTLLGEIEKSACGKIVLFLDVSSAPLLQVEKLVGHYEPWNDVRLHEAFDGAERRVCFASCTPGEASWSSGALKHGVWASSLIEALQGESPSAAERGGVVTCASLLKQWKAAVPRALRIAYTDKKTQTPQLYGGAGGALVIADVKELAASRKKKPAKRTVRDVARVALVRERIESVKKLSGFRKGTRVPDAVNASSQKFVGQLALEEIQNDLDKVHAELREAFKFKRLDLQVDGPLDGSGTIITPFFSYTSGVKQNPRDPAEVIWRREVIDIVDAEQILTKPFAAVFAELFDTVEFAPADAVDLEALIDRIEALDDPRVAIDYDREITWCKLAIRGIGGEIKVTKRTFEIVKDRPESPKKLLQSFFDIQHMLVDTHDVRLIGFGKQPA
ncbi:MAG: caspase family protein [Planctomycetia bacterium]|nr:caspase family protein [Planctomycetia bacterium]